jgi:uncharacterized protein (TIGR02391 family)
MGLFDRIRDLQTTIREIGLGGSQLSLPAPRLLLLPDPNAGEALEEVIFSQIVTEPEIVNVSRDLFESGFYNQAVAEAFKALDKYIQEKVGVHDSSGTKLMNDVFSPNKPMLEWSDRKTISEIDEQKGYHFLFSGAFTGIRNPTTHEIEWISDHQEALDSILVAQHLLRRAKEAQII